MSRYAIPVDVPLSHDQAVETVTKLLAEQGFGVLSTIDIQATLQKKLGVHVGAQTILGACNPPFAHEALQGQDDIAVLLPCNVVVKERDAGHSTVFVTDVQGLFSLVDNAAVAPVAAQVAERLGKVADGLRAL